MADYLYSVAIQAISFHNNIMADKTVWWISRGRINKYSLLLEGIQTSSALSSVKEIQKPSFVRGVTAVGKILPVRILNLFKAETNLHLTMKYPRVTTISLIG